MGKKLKSLFRAAVTLGVAAGAAGVAVGASAALYHHRKRKAAEAEELAFEELMTRLPHMTHKNLRAALGASAWFQNETKDDAVAFSNFLCWRLYNTVDPVLRPNQYMTIIDGAMLRALKSHAQNLSDMSLQNEEDVASLRQSAHIEANKLVEDLVNFESAGYSADDIDRLERNFLFSRGFKEWQQSELKAAETRASDTEATEIPAHTVLEM